MKSKYDKGLKSHVSFDNKKRIRAINHTQEYFLCNENIPRKAAIEYFNKMATTYELPQASLKNMHQKVSFTEPKEQGVEYRLSEEKSFFDSATVGFFQTYLNLPVWGAGLSSTIKQNPNRVAYSVDTSQSGFDAKLPDEGNIRKYKEVFKLAEANQPKEKIHKDEDQEDDTATFLHRVLHVKDPGFAEGGAQPEKNEVVKILGGRFFIYRYEASKRQMPTEERKNSNLPDDGHSHPVFLLPRVAESIKEGSYYVVAEIVFTFSLPQFGELVWRALVEVDTDSILYIKCMTMGANGLVFVHDPISQSGNLANNTDQTSAVLNGFRDDVALTNLDAPVAMVQSLRGTYVNITNVESPVIAPPTNAPGVDFDYDARTNEFAAVSAYYHMNNLFTKMEDLGFDIPTYFDGTTFPISVDHRGLGNEINAHWSYNFAGGTAHMCFALCDDTDLVNPLGRAVDPWVHWHEMGGHGSLGDHVDDGNLGFAHSAGDSLAAIQNDPTSGLRAVEERFKYAPFRGIPETSFRWFGGVNRQVADGWGWGGVNDLGMTDIYGYKSEQILAATNFEIYRAIGGDSPDLARRQFASRVMTYLILRTISTLTPATNPAQADGFCTAMKGVDLLDWTTEGLSGGAYNKVIQWAFEKWSVAPGAVSAGAVSDPITPREIDVYINDGRNGGYGYKHDHWNNYSVWNRHDADGIEDHEPAVEGETNYAYVKIKNRGTTNANDVVVKGYHCLPGAGLTWPVDFAQMLPLAGVTVPVVAGNNASEVIAGPFEWTPNYNVYGHDCLLMILSTDGDPSNVDNFTMGETIEEWRLVPHDNNIGQRNVNIVPGGGESEGLYNGLHERIFYAGNTFRKPAKMELKVNMPELLLNNGWKVSFKNIAGNHFDLKAGEKRRIELEVKPGKNFTTAQVKNSIEKNIAISVYANGILMGGMTYQMDPNVSEPLDLPKTRSTNCADKASDLLKCLKIGDGKVKKVCVKKVSLDIEMDNDCNC